MCLVDVEGGGVDFGGGGFVFFWLSGISMALWYPVAIGSRR